MRSSYPLYEMIRLWEKTRQFTTVEPCAGGEGRVVLCLSHFVHYTYDVAIQCQRLEPEVIVNVRGPDHRRLSVNWLLEVHRWVCIFKKQYGRGISSRRFSWQTSCKVSAHTNEVPNSTSSEERRCRSHHTSYCIAEEYLKELTLSCRRCTNSTLLACKQTSAICYIYPLYGSGLYIS